MPLTNDDLQKIGLEMGKVIENNVNPQFGKMRTEIDEIKAQMVTKDYLDDKLADLRGDLVVLMRKEDTKLIELVKTLQDKNILAEDEVKRIMEMEPFPKLSL